MGPAVKGSVMRTKPKRSNSTVFAVLRRDGQQWLLCGDLGIGRASHPVVVRWAQPAHLEGRQLMWELSRPSSRTEARPLRVQPAGLLELQPDRRFPKGILYTRPAEPISSRPPANATGARRGLDDESKKLLLAVPYQRPPGVVEKKRLAKPTEHQCRECLTTKPVRAFASGNRRRCLDCGGQEKSVSVRTVRGGLVERRR